MLSGLGRRFYDLFPNNRCSSAAANVPRASPWNQRHRRLDRWCPELEDALERRGWRQWARRYMQRWAQYSPGYRAYRRRRLNIRDWANRANQ